MAFQSLGFAALLLLSGASAITPPTVSTYAEPGADLGRYRTYSWADSQPPEGMDPRLYQRIRASIDRRLTDHGINFAPDGGMAVTFTIDTRSKVKITDYGQSSPGWRRALPPESNIKERKVTESTLTIELLDQATKNVLWRGSASQILRHGQMDQTAIDRAVDAILARLPR